MEQQILSLQVCLAPPPPLFNQQSLACGVLDLIPATRIWGERTQQQPFYRQKGRTKNKKRNHPLQRTVGNKTCTERMFSFLCNRGSLTNERVGLPSTCLRRLYREKTPPEAAEKEKKKLTRRRDNGQGSSSSTNPLRVRQSRSCVIVTALIGDFPGTSIYST